MKKYLDGITISSYGGDAVNNVYGVLDKDNGVYFVNTTSIDQHFYNCKDFQYSSFCKRNSISDFTTQAFNFTYLIDLCKQNPNMQIFSNSYTDIS